MDKGPIRAPILNPNVRNPDIVVRALILNFFVIIISLFACDFVLRRLESSLIFFYILMGEFFLLCWIMFFRKYSYGAVAAFAIWVICLVFFTAMAGLNSWLPVSDGIHKDYYLNGKVKIEQLYRDGLLVQELHFSDTGELVSQQHIQYYPDKTKQMERIFDNKTGKAVLRLYGETGRLEREDTGFKGDLRHSRRYDEQGNIKNPGEDQ